MAKINVAVLRGGPSHGYYDSLKTGAYVLNQLGIMAEKYKPHDIFISKDNEWHKSGIVGEPQHLLKGVDVVWNALHGEYGESGDVQRLLESLRIPYTGSTPISSALAHNKDIAKDFYNKHLLLTPNHDVLSIHDATDFHLVKLFQSRMFPVIVKPTTGVRAAGIHIAKSFHELKEALKAVFSISSKALVEDYIPGTVASCMVLEKARGKDIYTFLPEHLETDRRRIRPTSEQNRKMEEMAERAHHILGLRHYSSSDFIITPNDKIFILETNSHPVIHEESLAHLSLEKTGWNPKDFTDHLIDLALNNKFS